VAQRVALRAEAQREDAALTAGSLLVLAHELCREEPFNDRGPLWEFLRHCRNGIAHGGHFRFTAREPARSAQWRAARIDRGLQGRPVFRSKGATGLLEPGDPIRLLWDIEQSYPAIPRRRADGKSP
jgi:hypothetical protein